jgi:hypothetical protein
MIQAQRIALTNSAWVALTFAARSGVCVSPASTLLKGQSVSVQRRTGARTQISALARALSTASAGRRRRAVESVVEDGTERGLIPQRSCRDLILAPGCARSGPRL